MADDQRVETVLAVAADMEERRALRGADPFVQVAGVVRRSQAVDLDVEHPRRVRAVDEGVHPARRQLGHQLVDGQDEGRGRRDVVEHGQAGPRRDRGQHPFDDVLGAGGGKGKRHGHHSGAAGRGRDRQHVAAGVVLVVGRQQLVAGGEGEPAEDGIHAGGGVVDEGEVVRIGADERAERGPRRVEEALQVAGEERDRLGLHPLPDGALRVEDRGRGRSEGAVVHELDGRVERPEGAELGRHAAAIVDPMAAPPSPGPAPPRAVICDLDGTLVDTVPTRIEAWLATFAAFGLPPIATTSRPSSAPTGSGSPSR